MIDAETLSKLFTMKCKLCAKPGYIAWVLWANLLYDEEKNEMICWGCGHMHGIIEIDGPHDVLVKPEYRRAR